MTEPLILQDDEKVTMINSDWLNDDYVMTLKERQDREESEKGDG